MIKTILIALDGSELAEQAIPIASAVAAEHAAEVVLATAIVQHDGWRDRPVDREGEQKEQAAAAAYLRRLRRQLQKRGIQLRAVRVERGRPHVVIDAIAGEEGADLITMTTHGRSGFARWVMGSVADKVLQTSRRPVLLVAAREDGQEGEVQLKRILVPLDGSPLAEAALPFVQDLARGLHASLLLERVILPTAALYPGEFVPSAGAVLNEMEVAAGEYLKGVAKRIERQGITVKTNVEIGYPAETILYAAKQAGADLIALSTHGRSGPARWIMGSVADAVIRHSDRPCLVVPARGARPSAEERESPVPAALMAGTTVVPPPTLTETASDQKPRRVRAPEERPHRPERSPGR